MNVIEYGPFYVYTHRFVVFTEDAAAISVFFWLNQRILIKLMPLMLPSLTDCNSTYVIYFYVYFYDARTYLIPVPPSYLPLLPLSLSLSLSACFYLLLFFSRIKIQINPTIEFTVENYSFRENRNSTKNNTLQRNAFKSFYLNFNFTKSFYEVVLLRSFRKFMVDVLQMAFINHQIKNKWQ